jgi:hypothetical protein
MTLTQNQCFLAVLLIAAARGYARGWHREIITCAIILGSVLFLTIGGGDALAQLLSTIPNMFRGVSPGLNLATITPNPTFDFLLLVGFTVLADFAGGHYGTAPKVTQHRLSGMLAGSVSGLALVYYITRQLLPSTTINLTSPSTTLATTWIIGVFGVGMMLLLLLALVRK